MLSKLLPIQVALRSTRKGVVWFFGLILLLVVSPILLLLYPFHLNNRRKLKKLAAGRDAEAAYQAFKENLSEFEEERVRVLYQKLQDQIIIDHFPILPEDDLCDDLFVDVEDLLDFFEERQLKPEQASTKALPLATSLLRQGFTS